MSNEVKRYIVASKDAHDFDLERIGPLAHERLMVCDTDYAALEAECERLSKLSVTSLMLDVVPGCDGGGVEIYAQSIADVYAKFGQLVEQVETAEQERDTLAAELAAIRAAGGEQVEVIGFLYEDGEILGKCDMAAGTFSIMASPDFDGNVSKLMTVAQHQRIVAAMAAELEQARKDAGAEMFLTLSGELARVRAELEAARKQEPAAWVAKGNITELKRAKEPTWVQAWNKDRHGRVALYALPPLAGQVGVPRELLAKWLVHVEARERQYDEIYTEGDKLRALLATPSMEVKS